MFGLYFTNYLTLTKSFTMKKIRIVCLILFCFSTIYPLSAQKVSQWRGPARDGKYNETQLLNVWPDKGPEMLWSTEEIGLGYAAPVVTDDKLYINGEADSTSYLFAFGLNGKLIWKSPNGREFFGKGYAASFPGSRSTPTVVGNLIYATSGLGRIACFDAMSGKELWAKDMLKDLGGILNEFGYAESLLVDAKNVYCFPGGNPSNIMALDRMTGKTVWTSAAKGDTSSFCSPILVKLPTRSLLVTFGRYNLMGIDISNGELLWSYKIGFKWDGGHCNTPVYDNGYIYYSTDDEENSTGTIKLELSADGKSIKEVWRNRAIRNAMGGLVKIDNKLYLTTKANYLKAMNTDNGLVADSLKTNHGSLIFADNKLICYGSNGDVKLVTFDKAKMNISGKLKISKGSKEHFAHPVLANGVMYIRHGKALMAYKVK
jgi:outer membrane protein assembly factor BamB